jgi:Na+-transporting methylmalonyl-CoA/oxaloacetate decarboxylase gamma subunit
VAPYPGIQATIDRTPMTGPGAWLPGQQIAIGSTLIGLAGYEPPDAALHPSEDGTGIDFNRPPRLLPPARVTKFRLPSPPDKQARRSLPILTAIAPMIMGVGMYFLTHEIYMLAMCGMSPLMMVFSYLNSKKEGKQSYAQKMAEYASARSRSSGTPSRRSTRSGYKNARTAPTRRPCCPSPPARGAGSGSAAAPTPTSSCSCWPAPSRYSSPACRPAGHAIAVAIAPLVTAVPPLPSERR